MNAAIRTIHLTGGEVSIVVALDDRGPRVLHWGKRLAAAEVDWLAATSDPAVTFSSFDAPRHFGLLPVTGDGWSGTPALEWHRAGTAADPALVLNEATAHGHHEDGTATGLTLTLDDERSDVRVGLTLTLDSHGVLSIQTEVTSTATSGDALDLAGVRAVMPLPARATELLDFSGRWTRERAPQRMPVVDGSHRRTTRRGRPGHDAPFLTMVGTQGFGFGSGEVWSAHVAWSGDQDVSVERLPEGAGVHSAAIVAGELLAPGEVRLGPDETYRSPIVIFARAETGIDQVSEALHGYARDLSAHPATPRPLTLNTWEAVYFEHDPARLIALAGVAARVGVERFVLDDGWFVGRPNDRSGLGDWVVDTSKWPAGVEQLADVVHVLGMEFGLWFEPEMVNRDSDLARQHPEWLLGTRDNPAEWRHQLVLDLTLPDVHDYLLERMSAAVTSMGLDYIKWDHNRDLHGAVSRSMGGAPAVHRQTAATYALIDALRERHPELEIESCASGGARVDLGILARTQRVWASDTNDPVERQSIQRWTGVLVPPEVMGSHLGPATAHTTHRTADLEFRLTTALFGHAGIEWDLGGCSEDELALISRWAETYKELRPLLHHGRTVRADSDDPGALLHGVVSHTGDHALFAWVRVSTSSPAFTPRTQFPGLDPSREYTVIAREELGLASRHQVSDPPWMTADQPLKVTGRFLAEVGIPLPLLNPGTALVLEFRASSVTPSDNAKEPRP
ncbi:alpha-galactosidase [Demequina aurantiaca]|uniref:alpha-galactosidase n=1 Tax=Demequina aurantiaca TaxID=676200 RepID=UPI0007864508|nr:alpha-galactosidase [Demequina aurantiaca]